MRACCVVAVPGMPISLRFPGTVRHASGGPPCPAPCRARHCHGTAQPGRATYVPRCRRVRVPRVLTGTASRSVPAAHTNRAAHAHAGAGTPGKAGRRLERKRRRRHVAGRCYLTEDGTYSAQSLPSVPFAPLRPLRGPSRTRPRLCAVLFCLSRVSRRDFPCRGVYLCCLAARRGATYHRRALNTALAPLSRSRQQQQAAAPPCRAHTGCGYNRGYRRVPTAQCLQVAFSCRAGPWRAASLRSQRSQPAQPQLAWSATPRSRRARVCAAQSGHNADAACGYAYSEPD